MVDIEIEAKALLLRNRVNQLLYNPPPTWQIFNDMMLGLEGHGWSVTLFGGMLRDIMLNGIHQKPRDVDVVVGNVTSDHLFTVLSMHTKRRTRFGGLHLKVEGWNFDVWPLCETWAFRHDLVHSCSAENLPKTTFLNVEAIALTIPSTYGQEVQMFSHGFFEAVLEGQVEINLEENPFPALCVARSMITASKLGFKMGSRLVKYIAHYSKLLGPEEIHAAHLSHYGKNIFSLQQLALWLSIINESRRFSKTAPIRLPEIAHTYTESR